MCTNNITTKEAAKEIIKNLHEQQRRKHYFIKNYPDILNILGELVESENFSKILYDFVYDITECPICICGLNLKFKGFGQGYNKYCSKKCTMSDLELIEKRNNKSLLTSQNKYGVSNPMKNIDIKNKVKTTNILRYGVDNYTKSQEYKTKTIETNNIKYGKDWYLQSSQHKEKMSNKEHHTRTEIFKNKIKMENNEKWGVDNFSKTLKFKEIMDNYYKSEDFTINKDKEKEKIIQKIFNYYDNYDTNYKLSSIKNDILTYNCLFCGNLFDINKQLFYLRLKNKEKACLNCNPIVSGKSNMELDLLDFIKANYTGEIISNSKTIINPLELDIYVPELKIAFEFNGLYWHSEEYKEKNYHLNKTLECNKAEINLTHIWEDDWLYKQEIVKSMILNKLGKSTKIFARKCQIKVISDNKIIKDFLIKNHIQGFVGSTIKLGLYYNDELVSLMTFGNLRKSLNTNSKQGYYELLRFCNKLNFTVIGGASKLFTYFIKNYKYKEIISYSDYSRSTGNMYLKLKFNLSHLASIGYYWFKDSVRYNRFNFRKDILVKEGYDKNKTEIQIMHERGYKRLFDCGMQKWIYK